jgi:hypothetical protein
MNLLIKLLLILGGIFLIACCGCSHIPPANFIGIASTSTRLVLHDSTGHLRTFDPKTEKWTSRISYPKMSYSSSKVTPSLYLMHSYDNYVIINVVQGDNNNIYKYSDDSELQIESKIAEGRLTAIDDNYYFVTSYKTINIPRVEHIPSNYRINIKSGERIDHHFSEYPNLIVLDTLKHDEYTFYLAVSKDQLDPKDDRNGTAIGSIYLLQLSDNHLKQYLISDTKDITYYLTNPLYLAKFVAFSGSKVSFIVPTKSSGSKICNYDVSIKCIPAFTDTPRNKSNETVQINDVGELAWDSAFQTIQGINIASGERINLMPPDKVNLLFSPNAYVHISNNYLWSAGYKLRPFVGDMPYLIRFSTNDGTSRGYELEPGLFEGLETVFYNFLKYFLPVTYLGPG